tara:strand:- start:25692 stop:25970 length:279 start_codon:yes stop_codon:yes gene_type:complete
MYEDFAEEVGHMARSRVGYGPRGYDVYKNDVDRLRAELADIKNDLSNERRRLGWLKGLVDGMLALFWFSLFGFMLYCLVLGIIVFIGDWINA